MPAVEQTKIFTAVSRNICTSGNTAHPVCYIIWPHIWKPQLQPTIKQWILEELH